MIGGAIALVVAVAAVVGVTGSSRDAPLPPAEPEMTNVYMTCEPNDSTVTRVDDGKLLGRTPMTLTFPKGNGQVTVIVHKDGYQDRRVDVPLFSATGRIDVQLTRLDGSTGH
jgi:hypothetical protein